VLEVETGSTSVSTASRAAAKYAHALDHRLRLAEAGSLRGKPVKLPPGLKKGPPSGGPDLSTLVLTPADLGGTATVANQGYEPPGEPSLSEYTEDMAPAGTFAHLSQDINWYPNANDATVLSRFEGVATAYAFASGLLTGGLLGQFTQVDVSAAGDDAYGGTITIAQQGQATVYLGVISLSAGKAADVILVDREAQIQSSDLVTLAQAAANRLDAGLSG